MSFYNTLEIWAELKKNPIAFQETASIGAANEGEVYSPTVIKSKHQTAASFS